jgi:transcriptional regulator with XRE-family HTH domain
MAPSVSVMDLAERLTAIVVAQVVLSGAARDLRRQAGLSAAEVGALCGVSAAELTGWEDGLSVPATGQAMAWLGLLTSRAVARRGSFLGSIRQPHARQDIGGLNLTAAKAEHEAEVAAEAERVSELERLRRKAAR